MIAFPSLLFLSFEELLTAYSNIIWASLVVDKPLTLYDGRTTPSQDNLRQISQDANIFWSTEEIYEKNREEKQIPSQADTSKDDLLQKYNMHTYKIKA